MQQAGQTVVNLAETGISDPQGNELSLSNLSGAEITVGVSTVYLPLLLR